MACLGQRVFDKSAERLLGLADAEFSLRNQRHAQRRQHGLQFDEFAGVVGCQDDFHKQIGL
jgi:hypothetical protein